MVTMLTTAITTSSAVPPIEPEITLKGYGTTPEENARIIVKYLEDQGYLNNH